jgi:hypothetical protein
MKQKLFILLNLFYFIAASTTFAHGSGEVDNTSALNSVWVYVFSSFILLALLGYAYAFYLNKQLKKQHTEKNQKEIRQMKQALDKKRLQVSKVSTGILVVGFVVSIIWAFSGSKDEGIDLLNSKLSIDVETFASEGTDHINPSESLPLYETFPPTSGPHFPQWEKYGYYEKPLPLAVLIHNLEHGDIVIYYKPTLNEEAREHLKYLSQFTKKGSGVVVVPNDQIEGEAVATAWTRRMVLTTFDEKKLGQFIYDFIYEGPEKLPPQQ